MALKIMPLVRYATKAAAINRLATTTRLLLAPGQRACYTEGVRSARLFRIEGRVQGVGFRWFAQRVAMELKLDGYVKNLYDGSVEVYAAGGDARLDQLRQRLEAGPPGARVAGVDESPAPVRDIKGFHIDF